MRRLTLGGVPLHPALVHFPIAFWYLAPVLGVWAFASRQELMWQLSYWSAIIGSVIALPAMLAGILDALSVEAGESLQRDLQLHSGLMSIAWCLFAVLPVVIEKIPPEGGQVVTFLALQLLGVILLSVGAHVGGRLTYTHHMPNPDVQSSPEI